MIDPLDAAEAEEQRRTAGRALEQQQVWLVQQVGRSGAVGAALLRCPAVCPCICC